MSNEQEEWKLAEYLAQRVIDRGTGASADECLRNFPRDVFFVGNLRPRPLDNTDTSPFAELRDKLSPMAFGAEFRLGAVNGEVIANVSINWTCYYRVFPKFRQQCDHQNQTPQSLPNDIEASEVSTVVVEEEPYDASSDLLDQTLDMPLSDADSETLQETNGEIGQIDVTETANDRRRLRSSKDSLFIRFRKIACTATGQVVLCNSVGVDWQVDASNLQAKLNEETMRAQSQVLKDPERIRTSGSPEEKISVPASALESRETYSNYLNTLNIDVTPDWEWQVQSEVRINTYEEHEETTLFLSFVNVSPMLETSPNSEAFLFNTKAEFSFINATVLPFELEMAPQGFRYDGNLWGHGFNCAVDHVQGDETVLVTTHAPIYRQMRYQTRSTPRPRFDLLAEDPIPTLITIFNAMRESRHTWRQSRERYVNDDLNWQATFGAEFDEDEQKFIDETERFRRGCQMIRENRDVYLAFQLTNETFRRMGEHPEQEKQKVAWRLFQIVFFVSQIPAMVALATADKIGLEERNMVDIIYFPTGGGKTEAYLGVVVFHCFYDRLRGKSAGVTTWTRFPLRLLTLQQTQRFADVISIADLVRQENADTRLSGPDIDGFAVGYFVGQGGSPNELADPELVHSNDKFASQVIWSKALDKSARQEWKRVSTCPSCRTTTITVDFDPSAARIIHRCTNVNCAFHDGVIPVYIVDNEIYRYLPSVMVGTIDKLAGLGNQRKLAQVFGQVDGRCTVHGYYKGKCCQKDCSDPKRLKKVLPHGLTGPTLFVQDELHLLKEGLGTFDSHYETFIQRLRLEFGQTEPLKIIASSATIEAFARQVEHLYGRQKGQARVFPGPGPTLKESFYAETMDYPQREFVGIIPHNKTILNTILELIEFYHREIQYLQRLPEGEENPYGGVYVPGSAQWRALLDYYATSLTYFSANRELNSIRTDISGDVNPNLEEDGMQPLDVYELTGNTSTDEVTRVLEHISSPCDTSDAVLATSMVSHGVDIDRFNSMFFYGMPRQNAEYIQASSRVGRSHIGLVFACLHPARERDRSHYTYFAKFHEYLGQMVEPVAINRWSKFSINRTLPGLFMAVLLQLLANRHGEKNPGRYYQIKFVSQQISMGLLSADNFIPFLKEAYLVNEAITKGELSFEGEITLRVKQFMDQILDARVGESMVSSVLIPKPLMSLRDVDETINIELDAMGTQWANRTAGR